MTASFAYFDTSVLVKRYVNERGSGRARALLRRYRLVSSAIAPVEAVSALMRRRAAREMKQQDFAAALAALHGDSAYWMLVEISPRVLREAEELLLATGVRTLDALHLASAMVFVKETGASLPFATADRNQRLAAERMRLEVIWIESLAARRPA